MVDPGLFRIVPQCYYRLSPRIETCLQQDSPLNQENWRQAKDKVILGVWKHSNFHPSESHMGVIICATRREG